jgi:crotonobetainyl-CoA:carnitine CoA-transferase CaiB-like acyl-CoA transferase
MIDSSGFGALNGVIVLDMTRMLSGPYASMLFADQGATVIKVEPLFGDDTRKLHPFPEAAGKLEFGAYYQSINRNKLDIAIDLKQEAGRDIIVRLARKSDILLENFRVGVMERMQLAYEQLHEINPRLVYGAIRGFGDPRTGASPYQDWPAYDIVAQAMGGVVGITGPKGGDPTKVGPGIGDTIPAIFCAFAALSALHHARATGKGQFVDVAMVDAILAMCERPVYQYSYQNKVAVPEGNGHPEFAPYGLFQAADGWVAIGCPRDDFWVTLCRIMGKPELGAAPGFETIAARRDNAVQVNAVVSDWAIKKTKSELTEVLGGIIPYGPVNTAADLYGDPHIAARDMLREVEHPGSGRGFIIANTPIRMTETPGGVNTRAPLLGEHSDHILRFAGYEDEQIASLRDRAVVR